MTCRATWEGGSCDNLIRAAGLCDSHYRQRARGKPYTSLPGRESNVAKPCRGPKCDLAAIVKGLCAGHYQQKLAGKPLRPLQVMKPRTYTEDDEAEPVGVSARIQREIERGERCPRCALALPHEFCNASIDFYAASRRGSATGLP